MKKTAIILGMLLVLVSLTSCQKSSEEKNVTTIVFGDLSWDSAQVHNRIAAFIIENGFDGYKADFTPGDTIPVVNAIMQGDIDVEMESWHGNFPEIYKEGIESGKLIDLGENMPDAPQGWYIPRYLVEGADALAPELKSIEDLPKYASLFKDPEDPSKGIIYGGVAGWSQMMISEEMFAKHNLEETYNLGIAGSNAALAGSMAGAFKKGNPWIGYYWEPTAIMGKLDMIRLKGSEYERAFVNILVNPMLEEKAPEVVELLKKYKTTVTENNAFLVAMDENDLSTEDAAKWFLKNYETTWTAWVTSDIAEKVKSAL